jgi:hypothetical protein
LSRDLHKKRTCDKELICHHYASEITQDFKKEATAHYKCEAVSAVKEPGDDMYDQENREDSRASRVCYSIRNIPDDCIVERTKRWSTLAKVSNISYDTSNLETGRRHNS